jgi:hypothetical protein
MMGPQNNNHRLPGTMTHDYNPSYSGGKGQEGYGLRPTQGKSSQDPHLNQQKLNLNLMAHTCYPSYTGRINRRTVVQASPGVNTRPYLKNN